MAITASGQGAMFGRVDPDTSDAVVDRTNAGVADMRGRPMKGWLRVDAEHLRTNVNPPLVERGTTDARTRPAERETSRPGAVDPAGP